MKSMRVRVGRPPRSMPPQIDASPEEIARVALNAKPREKDPTWKRRCEWLKGTGAGAVMASPCSTNADREETAG